MMKRLLFLILVSCPFAGAFATHNRAGEITYEHLGDPNSLRYRVTITTYTRTSSVSADRPTLDSVHWGDGTISVFTRSSKVSVGIDISRCIYINTHTYPGNGSYLIHFEDPNRNADIINVPSSVNVPFYVQTLLVINPFQGPNSSPVLLQPPIDHGCKDIPFIHNANAYDVDGDSISYALTVCRGAGGLPIPGYTLPTAANSFTLDPITGDLYWDSPDSVGEYNVAFLIHEWRNGVIIGTVTRDMQITIGNCQNNNVPPIIEPMADTCVMAGDTLSILVRAHDPNGDNIHLTATGGPFEVPNQATFIPTSPIPNDTMSGTFTWITACNNVRRQPFRVEFKAQDDNTLVNLVDLKGFFIHVIAPPPQNLVAVAAGSNINLSWDQHACIQATGYRIYRRSGPYPGVIPCPCDNGAPSYTGYSLIGTTNGLGSTSFVDDNNGNGLVIGIEYCYIVTAVFADGSESCASAQSCQRLRKDLPVLTNASVNFTSATNGSIYVAWSKPSDLDTVAFPGPYQYRLYHSPGFNGSTPSLIVTKSGLNDTTYVDSLIDTDTQPWSYRVDLYYDSSGVPALKGSSTLASSVFLTITPTDNRLDLSWQANVPWTNIRYDIFKLNTVTSLFDSLTTVTATAYSDTGLENGTNYCYYIRTVGSYLAVSGFVDPIVNLSEQECAIPIDNVPPCAPPLTVLPSCTDFSNGLVWTLDPGTCDDDVDHFDIYYSPTTNGNYELIQTITDGSILTFNHENLGSVTGCYKVIAVDSLGNQSVDAIPVCVDTCSEYVLPSVFTPNGDGFNDLFHPCDSTTAPELFETCPPYRNVRDVNMTIFNRWGTIEFVTTDKDVNWDGKNKDSGRDCPDGVYYYICDVNFFTLHGTEMRTLTGFVHLIRGKK